MLQRIRRSKFRIEISVAEGRKRAVTNIVGAGRHPVPLGATEVVGNAAVREGFDFSEVEARVVEVLLDDVHISRIGRQGVRGEKLRSAGEGEKREKEGQSCVHFRWGWKLLGSY